MTMKLCQYTGMITAIRLHRESGPLLAGGVPAEITIEPHPVPLDAEDAIPAHVVVPADVAAQLRLGSYVTFTLELSPKPES
jgi:hypothetical protein